MLPKSPLKLFNNAAQIVLFGPLFNHPLRIKRTTVMLLVVMLVVLLTSRSAAVALHKPPRRQAYTQRCCQICCSMI